MKKRFGNIFLALAMGLFLISGMAYGANANKGSKTAKLTGASDFRVTAESVNKTLVNVGQVAMWVRSNGETAREPGGDSGLFFPRGSTPTTAAIFADGFIYGGKVNDGISPSIRVGGSTYSPGMVPGAIISKGVGEDRAQADRIWRVRRDYATANLRQDAAELFQIRAADVTDAQIAEVRALYKSDWRDWPAHKGAPFYDADGDGQYNPEWYIDPNDGIEKPVLYPDADEPGYADADQVVWLVANDLDEATMQDLYGSPPVGFEMQVTLWAYARSDALGNIIFKQFRLIYKGTANTPDNATIDSLYFCQWSDPDIGTFTDDFAGTDTTLSLGYAYNASTNDATYFQAGLAPPAAGYDFFAGPIVEDPGSVAIFGLKERPGYRNLPMTTFAFFAAGQTDSDPSLGTYDGTLHWWNLLRGFRPRPISPPEPWTTPEGVVTMFRVPGDPVTGEGWIDSNPGDRRILLASGPFTMALGDTNETVVSVIAALGSDRLSSVAALKFFDRSAQFAFDNLFDLPKPPPAPPLVASEFDGKILLNWGADQAGVEKTEKSNNNGFVFEGYNIYQLPSAGASLSQGIKLATYDVINEVTVISQETFDENSGLVLDLPAQLGRNSGLVHTFLVDFDRIRQKPLRNGQVYYFGVTAYNYNPEPGLAVKTLESPPAIVTVIPQTTKPGVRLQAAIGDTLPGVEHATGGSDGSVVVLVTDPTKLTGNDYKVVFREDTTLGPVWDLLDVTKGEVVLANQTNQTGDDAYLNVDGMTVKVFGAPSDYARVSDGGPAFIEVANEAGPLAESSYDGRGAPFGGNYVWHSLNAGGFADRYFLSTTTPDESGMRTNFSALVPYDFELRFTEEGSWAWWAFTTGNFAKVPFELWNIGIGTPDDPSDDYRMIPIMYEGGGTPDAYTPDHGPEGAFGFPSFDRIYWYNPATSYEDYAAAVEAGTLASDPTANEVIGRLLVADFDQNGQPPATGTVIRIFSTKPNTPADTFTFSTQGYAPTVTEADKKADLDLITAFPNPYYGTHSFEPSSFQRSVTFSHLPEKATIRIFNLAGILVRTLEKNDDSQFLAWDLLNEDGLPVASGVYVANIEMPALGNKIVKLAIVQEQQFLRNF